MGGEEIFGTVASEQKPGCSEGGGPVLSGEGCPGCLTEVGASDWGRGGDQNETGRSADLKWCSLGTSSNVCKLTTPSSTLPLLFQTS